MIQMRSCRLTLIRRHHQWQQQREQRHDQTLTLLQHHVTTSQLLRNSTGWFRDLSLCPQAPPPGHFPGTAQQGYPKMHLGGPAAKCRIRYKKSCVAVMASRDETPSTYDRVSLIMKIPSSLNPLFTTSSSLASGSFTPDKWHPAHSVLSSSVF